MNAEIRGFRQTLSALTHPEHYVALWNMGRVYDRFWENFRRYLVGSGAYPYTPLVRTPVGRISPTLYSFHDMLTLNEVFCRIDYPAARSTSVVVDVGSNIGISALYFLTRNQLSRCYLYEPDPANVIKLEENLESYQSRYVLHQQAVSFEAGKLAFGTEATGRYGGLGVNTGTTIEVETVTINQVLKEVLRHEKHIDILKLDIEGLEEKTVAAIDPQFLDKIDRIYIEYLADAPLPTLFPNHFRQRQRGSICQFIKLRQP